MMHLMGAHESISGGLACAIDRGEAVGADVVQIFTKSNHRWTGGVYGEAEIDSLSERIAETGIDIVASHASYLINLATPDHALQQRSVAALIDEIERCRQLGIPNLVVHPGAHVGSGEEIGLTRVSQSLDRALAGTDAPVSVCLESTAGQGSTLGYKLEHLSTILNSVQSSNADRLGICLDTCHLFAAGYDLRDRSVFDEFLGTVESLIGLNRIKLVHVNDSEGGLTDAVSVPSKSKHTTETPTQQTQQPTKARTKQSQYFIYLLIRHYLLSSSHKY